MGHPAFSIPAQAFPVIDVERALSKLPARVRAELQWTRPAISKVRLQLRKEPLTDALVVAATEEMLPPLMKIGAALYEALGANPDALRSEVFTSLQQLHELLTDFFLEDPTAVDTLAWVMGYIRSFFEWFSPWIALFGATQDFSSILSEQSLTDVLSLARTAGIGGVLRGEILLAAVEDAAKAKEDRLRATELLELAFLQITQGVDALEGDGFPRSPFSSETSEQRAERMIRSVQYLRQYMTPEDERIFADARMQALR